MIVLTSKPDPIPADDIGILIPLSKLIPTRDTAI